MKYYDKNDKPLTENIEQTIKSDFCIGYSGYDPYLNLAICEALGRRPSQEDRLAYACLPNFDQLTSSNKMLVFKKTFAMLQERLGPLDPNSGSTAIVNAIGNNNIITAWIGDSVSFLIIMDKNEKVTEIKPLNQNLHHPDPYTEEGQRVLKAVKNQYPLPYEQFPNFWRLANGLAVSRAIGDNASEPYGLCHEPDFSKLDYQLPLGGRGFVLTACDGLTEAMSVPAIAEFIQHNNHLSLRMLAKALVERAIGIDEPNPSKWSWDNVSVMLAELGTSNNLILALFDGHNGSIISHRLSIDFFPTLFEGIK